VRRRMSVERATKVKLTHLKAMNFLLLVMMVPP
jgi:hypothetical protein